MLNGRLSFDFFNISDPDSLENQRSVKNYNFLVQTYLDYLISPKDAGFSVENRPLKQAILYVSFLLGPRRQTEAYVNFLLTVSDTRALKMLADTTKLYFDDVLCLTFMRALANKGINLVELSGDQDSSDINVKT